MWRCSFKPNLPNAPDVFPRRPLSPTPYKIYRIGERDVVAGACIFACVVETIILHYEDAKARCFCRKVLTFRRRCCIIISVVWLTFYVKLCGRSECQIRPPVSLPLIVCCDVATALTVFAVRRSRAVGFFFCFDCG